ETPRRNPGEIERGGAGAAHAGDAALHGGKFAPKFCGIAAPRVRDSATDDAVGEIASSRHAQTALVQKAAAAALGDKKLIGDRIEDEGGDDIFVLHRRNRDRELRNAMEKIRRAVERIDDPGLRGVAARDLAALFHDEAEGRARLR